MISRASSARSHSTVLGIAAFARRVRRLMNAVEHMGAVQENAIVVTSQSQQVQDVRAGKRGIGERLRQ